MWHINRAAVSIFNSICSTVPTCPTKRSSERAGARSPLPPSSLSHVRIRSFSRWSLGPHTLCESDIQWETVKGVCVCLFYQRVSVRHTLTCFWTPEQMPVILHLRLTDAIKVLDGIKREQMMIIITPKIYSTIPKNNCNNKDLIRDTLGGEEPLRQKYSFSRDRLIDGGCRFSGEPEKENGQRKKQCCF